MRDFILIFFLQIGGDSRWKVCCQWGLPRLVFKIFPLQKLTFHFHIDIQITLLKFYEFMGDLEAFVVLKTILKIFVLVPGDKFCSVLATHERT